MGSQALDVAGSTSSPASSATGGTARGGDLALGGINIGAQGGGLSVPTLGLVTIAALVGVYFLTRRKR